MARPKREAAFFDLDRTILLHSSAGVFGRYMVEAGLTTRTGGPVGSLLSSVYDLVGESGLLMQAARLAPRMSRGWDVAEVARVAADAAAELETQVLPFAREEIAAHQAQGRLCVLATTSPEHLVEPLAERLGMDGLIATRWATSDGVFTGEREGAFRWGRSKRDGVREWAEANDVDLSRSYAYSDSYYDAPLLADVGNPVAVNPDPRLLNVAILRGWPVRHFDAPPGVVKIAGRELQDLTRFWSRPELVPNARFDITGLEKIPAEGGAIVVANHRSYFDSSAMALIMARSGRNARFLGKKEVFDAPLIGRLAAATGGIRVDRGTGSDEPLEAAAVALRAGEIVSLMPQGTIPRGPAFFDPELKGRWGAARLAQMSKVPVIPVGLWGTEKVWPRSARLPHFDVRNPPRISVTIGDPVPLKYRSLDKDTKRIMAAIMALLPSEAHVRHEPTPEELARTYPAGYSGSPDEEVERRPGFDTAASPRD